MELENLSLIVPDKLFATAESLHVQGSFDLARIDAGPDVYVVDGPVSWQADITNTGGALLVSGVARAQATTACGRCLEDASYLLEGDIEGYFIIPGEDGQDVPEDDDEQDFEILGEDETIDFEPLIMAALYLELPVMPLCDDDCKGLCPKCGANLNQGECPCKSEDDGIDEMNPFAVLKGLKFD